jgi:hypothetical protein
MSAQGRSQARIPECAARRVGPVPVRPVSRHRERAIGAAAVVTLSCGIRPPLPLPRGHRARLAARPS